MPSTSPISRKRRRATSRFKNPLSAQLHFATGSHRVNRASYPGRAESGFGEQTGAEDGFIPNDPGPKESLQIVVMSLPRLKELRLKGFAKRPAVCVLVEDNAPGEGEAGRGITEDKTVTDEDKDGIVKTKFRKSGFTGLETPLLEEVKAGAASGASVVEHHFPPGAKGAGRFAQAAYSAIRPGDQNIDRGHGIP